LAYDKNWYRGRRVLVTGGMGFIGSHLTDALVELGAKVTVIDSLIPAYGGNPFNLSGVADKVVVSVTDIRDRYGMAYLVKDSEVIFNLAGQVSHLDSMEDPDTDLEINCRAQLGLMEALRASNQEARVVFASTRQVYGRTQYLPVDEKHPVNPTDVNGINKHAGEQYHLLYSAIYGQPTVVLRLTNTYGPRQLMHHSRQGFIPVFIRTAIEGREITLYGGGTQRRDANYVSDVVDAFLRSGWAANSVSGRIFNLGGTVSHTLIEFANCIVKAAGSGAITSVPWPADKAKIDIGDFEGSFASIETELGWTPKVSLEEGIGETVAFYREFGEHYW
jgi:UDP-glucose 4-epimerase